MSKRQQIWWSVAVGCLLAAHAAFGASGTLVTLTGHVPSGVSKLAPFGSLPATNQLRLAIGLPLRNQAAMQALLTQLYDPQSTNYHQFLTPEQFTAQFGPSPADYQAVLDFARSNNLTVTRMHGNRMLVDVTGKVSDIENSFHVKIRTYHHPSEARDFYAPDSEPTVDSNLPVLHIQGLDNYVLPKSMLHKATGNVTPGTGSGPLGSFIGRDFRNAYAPGSALTGAGQSIGLLQFDGYFSSDIYTYESLAGLTNTPLQNVLLDGFNGQPGAGNDEVCLDIEMSMSMAPGLDKIVVFEAGPFGEPDDILNSMASSNQIKTLSSSWGYGTDPVSDQIYKEFALQGQTYLNCSGDGDAWVGPIYYGACEDPNITIVGGTTLTMNGVAASYKTESVWNWGFDGDFNWNPDGYAGSSGGISTDVLIPTWQQGINMSTNQGSTIFRNVPDIALTADNIFLVSNDGEQTPDEGGTSAATPLWAGFVALINQQAAANGKSGVGFLAPQLYALSKTTNYNSCLHDVVTGNNTWDQSTNFYAVPGYDLCTGLGTPNGTNLIYALAGVPTSTNLVTISAPPEPYGMTMSTMNGGSPNGTWALFVQDDIQFNQGEISNGWILNLTLASPVGSAADLGIAMTASAGAVQTSGSLVYYLSVTNYGGLSTATNVVAEDALATNVTYVGSSATLGSVTAQGQHLVWTIGNLITNQGASLAITVTAPSTVGSIVNYGFVSATTPDPNSDDNSTQLTVNVVSLTPPQLYGSYTNTNGVFTLNISGASGATTVQASTNLITWVSIYTTNTDSSFTFTDPNKTNYPYRFYRVLTGQ